jgi:hypothetical protein
MFKYPKVVSIDVVKRESKEPLRTQAIPSIPTGMVTRMALCHMLAAARSQETRVLDEKPRSPEWSARTRGKILYMAKHSCDDSCNT